MINDNTKLSSRDRAVLMKTRFLQGLSPASTVSMMQTMTIVSLAARRQVFRTGDRADAFYCVLGGYVRLYRLNKDGREADIRICAPGETFGECLLYADGPYPFHAQTAENATLARFDMAAVRKLATEETEIARA